MSDAGPMRLNLVTSKALLRVRKRIAGGFVGEVTLIVGQGGNVQSIRWLGEGGSELPEESDS